MSSSITVASAVSCLVVATLGWLLVRVERGSLRFVELSLDLDREVEKAVDLLASEDFDVCLVILPERVVLAVWDGVATVRW